MTTGLRGRFERTHLLVSLVVITVTAVNSYGYFHEDEYFQVLAFTWAKLGVLDVRHLPWEYTARIRPFMQPALYVIAARASELVGVHDVFVRATIFRAVTGLLSWASLVAFVSTSLSWFRDPSERRAHVRVATLLGMIPYLCVRTSSETLAMAAFTLGFAAVLSRRSGWRALSGLGFGFAFEFRFQAGLLVIGLLAWLLVVRRDRLRDLLWIGLAFLGPVALGAIVDRWGYGAWTPTPWSYFKVNLLEGVASRYGTSPPFAYVYLVVTNIFAPVVILWLVAFGLTIARHPRHVVTWTTVPFFVIHCLLAHKEERFVFPMLLIATSCFVLGFGPGQGRPVRWAARAWEGRRSVPAKVVIGWNFAGMALLAFYPLGWNHHARFYRLLHDESIEDFHAYALGSVHEAPPYTPTVFDVQTTTAHDVGEALVERRARSYLITPEPRLHTGVEVLDHHATLVASEMPAWQVGWFRDAVLRLTDAYDAAARPPLRKVEWWSLYRLDP